VPAAQVEAVLAKAREESIMAAQIGVSGGDALTLAVERPILVEDLRKAFEGWLPAFMAGQMA
jgi:hypothetical protein